jgi:two-component system, LytTR family, response regulator
MRAIVVDDEPLARERLVTLLSEHGGIEVVQECGSGVEALDAIQALAPDLVFLDVQMPALDGFEVIEQLEGFESPGIIFCTAYDEYAVRAFEANAIDYLLKPIDWQRLQSAIRRAEERLKSPSAVRSAHLSDVLANVASLRPHRSRLAVRDGDRYSVVKVEDIHWIEASDNYVLLHRTGSALRFRATMSEMEAQLDPTRFLRIHRSIIVNVDQVRSIQPWGLGEYLFVLASGRKLGSSRTYRNGIRDVFGC